MVARLRASYLYVIINLGVLGGSVVTYLRYGRLWIAALGALFGAFVANGTVALWYRHLRHSGTEGPAELVTQRAESGVARRVHWTKKVGVALATLGLVKCLSTV